MRILCALLMLMGVQLHAAQPENYLYTHSGALNQIQSLVVRSDIHGVQIVYNWKQLEPKKGEYDFSAIEHDLSILKRLRKKLFIQIQDRFFDINARSVPAYLLNDSAYHGGLIAQIDNPGEGKPQAQGWVAMQWDPAVRERYQALLAALGQHFDGEIAGINLPETAIDLDSRQAAAKGFTCDNYFAATLENMQAARKAFTHSAVVQYVNFWPCEWNDNHHYMSRLFATAEAENIGLGGPDIVPNKASHMKNAYPFFNQYKGKLPLVAMAVQEPTLTYTNPRTKQKFSRDEFTQFAEQYLGADIIFWSTESPWLQQQNRL